MTNTPTSPVEKLRAGIALLPELRREFASKDYKAEFLAQHRIATVIAALEAAATLSQPGMAGWKMFADAPRDGSTLIDTAGRAFHWGSIRGKEGFKWKHRGDDEWPWAETVGYFFALPTFPASPMAVERNETTRLKGVIEHDRSKVADILAEANAVLKGYWWLAEGRGSYEFDDDRWKDEFAACMSKLVAVFDPMRVIAGDLSDSPVKWADIVAARASTVERNEVVEAVKSLIRSLEAEMMADGYIAQSSPEFKSLCALTISTVPVAASDPDGR